MKTFARQSAGSYEVHNTQRARDAGECRTLPHVPSARSLTPRWEGGALVPPDTTSAPCKAGKATHFLAGEPDRLALPHSEGAHGAQPQGVVDQALRVAVDRPDAQVGRGVAARQGHRLRLLVELRGQRPHLPAPNARGSVQGPKQGPG